MAHVRIRDAKTIWELIERRAGVSGDAPMFFDEHDRVLTFADLRDKAERVAAGLHERGIGEGTRVTWQLPTRIETVVVSAALSRLGAVQNPIIHHYRQREVAFTLRQTCAEFFIHPGVARGFDYAAMADAITAILDDSVECFAAYDQLPDGDPAALPSLGSGGQGTSDEPIRWIYSTSGTTSDPKGVQHTDASLLSGGVGLAVALDMRPTDVGTIIYPYAHIGGPDYLVLLLCDGFPAVLMEAFSAPAALPLFNRHGVTMIGGGPAFMQMFLTEQRKQPGVPALPTLCFMSGGGAAMPPEMFYEVQREFRCRGAAPGYGMTEVPMITQGSPHDSDEQLAKTVGKPVQGALVRIVRSDGTDAAVASDGEIRVKGPMVCHGYTDAAVTAAAFDEQGWFRTGDIGHLRPDGHVVITGRLKDIIIRKSENISAKEIEDLLYTHPSVADVAVIGLPDQDRGERVCAVVETTPGCAPLTFAEMQAHLRAAQLMSQKIPEQLEVVDELPRNDTLRKVLKYKLRELFQTKPWP